MPSSPGPADYKRTLQRFFYRGISLLPQDALPEGKSAWALNIRSHQDGTWEPRYGQVKLTASALPGPIHSIFRLNDTTPFAEAGASARRILGSTTGLYGGSPGVDTYTLIDPEPYSGNPLTIIAATPINSPRPFAYVADSTRLRKVNSSFNDYPIGIAQPLAPPTARLAAPQVTYLNTVGTAAWTSYGGNATPAAPTPTPTINRVSATVTELLYDEGVTGMASVQLDDMDNVTAGMSLDIGASSETIIVHAVQPPVSPTTIGSILYDDGTTGLCTIQPTGSFSVGQIEAARPQDIEQRYRDLNRENPPRVTISRTVDFPVDSLVLLGGTETVRIQSVAIGADGVLSFRCFTFGTFAAGAAIEGLSSFRAYFNTTKSVGDPATALALEVVVTPPTDTDPVVGGVQSPMSGGWRNWALVGNRANQPEDIIRFGIRVSQLAFVESVRILLDLSPTGPAFLRDYYFYEWRASDLLSAIQAESEVSAGLVADAQADAVERGTTTALYGDQYGQIEPGTDVIVQPGGTPRTTNPGATTTGRQAQVRAANDGIVSLGAGLSRQLAIGDNAWMTLECRVGDLTRVGTDTSLTLGVILNAAIFVQINGTTYPITVDVSDAYIVGGYGPDVGTIMPPYVYRYSYRSTITGERSNPSPPMRAGVTPRRGRVALTATPSEDPQCDVVDFWRFGGVLARWAYVATAVNDPDASPAVVAYNDDMADRQIEGGERIRVDLYQPWPTQDLPRTGTCNVTGTSVEWVSGDVFNLAWAADSAILIDGKATQLYASPDSTTRLTVVDNIGTGVGVVFSLPSPTLLSQPLPSHWGGPIDGVWFTFACGDPNDPGILHWTNSNDPDASSDKNTLVVTSGSDPLLAGFFDDGIPYVFSTERLYRIVPTFGDPLSPFRVIETNCTRGLWARWFWCPHPDGGVFFGCKDGIYYTSGGSQAKSLTGPDLQPLFPQEGTDAEAIRNLNPIDWTATTQLRLSFVDQILYFDYVDTEGEAHTLVFDPRTNAWTPDEYAVGVVVRLSEPGPQVHDHILACADGNLRQVDSDSLVDVDAAGDLVDLDWAYWTVWAHGDDPRADKQWGDAILDCNPGGSLTGILVTPVVENGNVALTQQTIGATGAVRETFLIEVGTGGGLGYGVLSRNFGLWIEGAVQACDTNRPIFYLWEPAFLYKGTSIARRATDWEDLGYKGQKFIQGVVIRANTYGQTKAVQVQFDGPNAAPQLGVTLSLLHNGESSIAYPRADTGWQPFHAELVRLQGADDVDWVLLDWRFIWEPAPELATQWETQDTTFDLPGFLDVRDGVMAYAADADVELVVTHDDESVTYILPATFGEYTRQYVLFAPAKGKSVRFQWSSTLPFRLYKRDCSVRVQGWGIPGGYQIMSPFGGPHRADGAGI